MATAYVTDSWSSVTGLASVAYGSPSYHAEVANQVWRGSITSPIAVSTGSEIAELIVSEDQVLAVLQSEYTKNGPFSNYVDLGNETLSEIAKRFHSLLIRTYNEVSSYGLSLSSLIEYAWPAEAGLDGSVIASAIGSLSPDANAYSRIAVALPTNKLDKLPPDTVIGLEDNIPVDQDFRGLDLAVSYLTPEQYFSDIAYPGLGTDSYNIPRSLTKSIEQGYVGYPTTLPLDELLNSGFSEAIKRADISQLANVITGSGVIDMLKGLSPLGRMSEADQAMYDVSLIDLILAKNGYTIYTPSTDSPGNFSDPGRSTNFDEGNADPDSGLPFSQRTRTVSS